MSDTPKKTAAKKIAGARRSSKKPAARKAAASGNSASSKQKDSSKSQPAKHKHARLIRDSFTIPEDEYALLAETKKICLEAGFEIKKSELIRIGIALAYELTTSELKEAQQTLQPVKTGRPKKHK